MSSALAGDQIATAPSAIRSVWASPLYRGATFALFLSGLGTSAAAPKITLFLVNDLHVSLATTGLYYLTSISAPAAGYLVGPGPTRLGPTQRRCGPPSSSGRTPAQNSSTYIEALAAYGPVISRTP
jgi:hypothetical protein